MKTPERTTTDAIHATHAASELANLRVRLASAKAAILALERHVTNLEAIAGEPPHAPHVSAPLLMAKRDAFDAQAVVDAIEATIRAAEFEQHRLANPPSTARYRSKFSPAEQKIIDEIDAEVARKNARRKSNWFQRSNATV